MASTLDLSALCPAVLPLVEIGGRPERGRPFHRAFMLKLFLTRLSKGDPMREHPPVPHCRKHRHKMQHVFGEFPHRWFYCHECRFHWKECGATVGVVSLRPAFDQQ